MKIPTVITSKAKAIVGAVLSGVVAYVGTAIINSQPWDLHGLELAAVAAVLTALGVHQVPNRPQGAPSSNAAGYVPTTDAVKARLIRAIIIPETRKRMKRLGRHVEHDERSRAYAITAKPMSALVSIRHMRHGSILNQLKLGSCTGNAGTGAMMTSPFPSQKLTEKFARQLYSDATKVDNVPGQWPPTDTGSSGLAVAKVLKARGLIGSYLHCFSPEAVYTALQDGPVLVGVNWLTGFDTPTATGQMRYTGSSRGGHELCMDEIDVINQRVWVTNSWGKSWGISGRAWWSFEDFAKVMADQGDATVPKP